MPDALTWLWCFAICEASPIFLPRWNLKSIMRVLAEYYEAVGGRIMRYEATLTHFSGDGLMVLVNAPVPYAENPAVRAVRMAMDMQAAVQILIVDWRIARSHNGIRDRSHQG